MEEKNEHTAAHYSFDAAKMGRNVKRIRDAFSAFRDDFRIAYSFKTNASLPVISEALKLGLDAEVVSPYEYGIAKKAGFPTERIIYNGVIKDEATIRDCALGGGMVNLDNEEDVKIAAKISAETGRPIPVGLRLNFQIGNGIRSRFGIDVASPLFDTARKLDGTGFVVTALHCHFTAGRKIETWKKRVSEMKKYAALFPNAKRLDFGGNMAEMDGNDMMEQYAAVISTIKKEHVPVIEPGTPIISDAVDLVAHVTHIKEGFVFLDCSASDLGMHAGSDWCRIETRRSPDVMDSTRVKVEGARLVGYTCMEHDVLKKSFSATIGVGDSVMFRNIGAYSSAWANDFICPPLETIASDGT